MNGSESYAKGHIRGAIDFTANEDKLAANLPKNKEALVVAYCGNERCKAYMQAAIKAIGCTNVKHCSKGIAAERARARRPSPAPNDSRQADHKSRRWDENHAYLRNLPCR